MGSLVVPLYLICSLESLIKNVGNLYTFGLGRKLRRLTTDWIVEWTALDSPLPSTPMVAPWKVRAFVCLSSAHHLSVFSMVRITAGTELLCHILILHFYPALMWIAISEFQHFWRSNGVHVGNVIQPWMWAFPSPQLHQPTVPSLGCQQCPHLLLSPPQRRGPGGRDPFPESRWFFSCFNHCPLWILWGFRAGNSDPRIFVVSKLYGFHLPIIILWFLYF